MLQADLLRDPALSLALTDKALAAVEHTSLNYALGFRAGFFFGGFRWFYTSELGNPFGAWFLF